MHMPLQGTGHTKLSGLPWCCSLTAGNILAKVLFLNWCLRERLKWKHYPVEKSVGEEDTMNTKVQQRGTICT